MTTRLLAVRPVFAVNALVKRMAGWDQVNDDSLPDDYFDRTVLNEMCILTAYQPAVRAMGRGNARVEARRAVAAVSGPVWTTPMLLALCARRCATELGRWLVINTPAAVAGQPPPQRAVPTTFNLKQIYAGYRLQFRNLAARANRNDLVAKSE